jgi:hypothetical protein
MGSGCLDTPGEHTSGVVAQPTRGKVSQVWLRDFVVSASRQKGEFYENTSKVVLAKAALNVFPFRG